MLACAATFAGQPPRVRSLISRAPGRMTNPPRSILCNVASVSTPACRFHQRARRLDRDLHRYQNLQSDIAVLDEEITELLAATDGQILTTLPGVAVNRAAAFAAFSMPIKRFPDAEHLYSATGLAPALYQSATLHRRGRISRQGLPEHRDALMGMAWGLSISSPSFAQRNAELRSRGMAPIQARVALPATSAVSHIGSCEPNNRSMKSVIVEEGSVAGGDGHVSYAARRRNLHYLPRTTTTLNHSYDPTADISPSRRGPSRFSVTIRHTTSLPPVRLGPPARRTRKPAVRRRLISLPDSRPNPTEPIRLHRVKSRVHHSASPPCSTSDLTAPKASAAPPRCSSAGPAGHADRCR